MTQTGKGREAEARRCTEAVRDLLLGYKARMEDELRPAGVTLPQLCLLKAVAQGDEVSAATIARRCHVTPQTLQSMLTRATREGWITRGKAQGNGRIVTASLTRSGQAVLRHGLDLAGQIETEIWHGVPLSVMRTMRETIELGLANLDRG